VAAQTSEEWEIAVLHRDHRSNTFLCAATWVKVSPDQIDRGIDSTRRLSCPHSRSSTDFAVPACCSTGVPVVPSASATFDSG